MFNQLREAVAEEEGRGRKRWRWMTGEAEERQGKNAPNISQHWPGDNECVITEGGV